MGRIIIIEEELEQSIFQFGHCKEGVTFGIGRLNLKNYYFKLSVLRGLLLPFKCGFHEIWQKIVLFSFSGHPNGPKTTSHNKIVIMLFEGRVGLEITALSLN